MNVEEEYRERLQKIIAADPRFPSDAYDFVRDAVSYTTRKLKVGEGTTPRRHISGQELLEGVRELALRQFGPLTIDVLTEWNIRRTDDFGSIVFNLVSHNLLGASEEDSPADFANGYDFQDAFVKPFQETGPLPSDLPKIA
ncbi:MAG: hypothetical protein A3K19_07085 [Lentisphaerae bacterium RIFOXYB12_FULL_65_16]|nr:MAG: hypothetical protein A3K18_12240 [Lentisphaerae bacterium RIFOXYA12_64_32]OGV93286.1 MAG: hypothetical protein A3K19_07085 [Lentisphaerae bacterium RIFOXYB12_FULL_65_16]